MPSSVYSAIRSIQRPPPRVPLPSGDHPGNENCCRDVSHMKGVGPSQAQPENEQN